MEIPSSTHPALVRSVRAVPPQRRVRSTVTAVVSRLTVAALELEPPTIPAWWNVIDRTELIWFTNAPYPCASFRMFPSASAHAAR